MDNDNDKLRFFPALLTFHEVSPLHFDAPVCEWNRSDIARFVSARLKRQSSTRGNSGDKCPCFYLCICRPIVTRHFELSKCESVQPGWHNKALCTLILGHNRLRPPPLFRHRGGTIARTRFDRPPLYRVRRWNFLMHTDVKINCADRKDAALLNRERHRKFHSAWYRRVSPPTLLHDSVQTSGWQRHKGGNVRFENLWKPNWRMAQVAREFLRSN